MCELCNVVKSCVFIFEHAWANGLEHGNIIVVLLKYNY